MNVSRGLLVVVCLVLWSSSTFAKSLASDSDLAGVTGLYQSYHCCTPHAGTTDPIYDCISTYTVPANCFQPAGIPPLVCTGAACPVSFVPPSAGDRCDPDNEPTDFCGFGSGPCSSYTPGTCIAKWIIHPTNPPTSDLYCECVANPGAIPINDGTRHVCWHPASTDC